MAKGIFKGPGRGRAFGGFLANDAQTLNSLQKELGRPTSRVAEIESIGLVGETETFSHPFRGRKSRDHIRSK